MLLTAQVPIVPMTCKGGGSGKDLGSKLKTIPHVATSHTDEKNNCQPEEGVYMRISVSKAKGHLLTLVFIFSAVRIAQ